MKAAHVRLLLAACLFAAWIGWLAYLAVTTPMPIVLSRPQFLGADLDVIAEVKQAGKGPDSHIQVIDVPWARKGVKPPKAKSVIQVNNLSEVTEKDGWRGPGRYLLPLSRGPSPGKYEVTAILPSPGYQGGAPRIYPVTPETLHQEGDIRHDEWD